MSFNKNLKEMLSSEGKLSSKRIITFIAFICIVIAFFANLIFLIIMDAGILDGMITIVYAGLGVTVGEHILKKRTGEFKSGNDIEDYSPTSNRNYDTDDTRYQRRDNHRHNVDTQNDDQLGDN